MPPTKTGLEEGSSQAVANKEETAVEDSAALPTPEEVDAEMVATVASEGDLEKVKEGQGFRVIQDFRKINVGTEFLAEDEKALDPVDLSDAEQDCSDVEEEEEEGAEDEQEEITEKDTDKGTKLKTKSNKLGKSKVAIQSKDTVTKVPDHLLSKKSKSKNSKSEKTVVSTKVKSKYSSKVNATSPQSSKAVKDSGVSITSRDTRSKQKKTPLVKAKRQSTSGTFIVTEDTPGQHQPARNSQGIVCLSLALKFMYIKV